MRAFAIGMAAAIFTLSSARADTWQSYSDAGAGFSVQFPGAPAHKNAIAQMSVGPVRSSITSFSQGATKYAVEVDDYSDVKVSSDPQVVVQGGLNAIQHNSKIHAQSKFAVPGGAGRDAAFAMDGMVMRARLYYVAPHAYTLMVMADGKAGWNAVMAGDSAKFFQSFQLTKK